LRDIRRNSLKYWIRGIRVELSKDNILNIEVPNSSFETVYLRDVIDSRQFTTSRSQLLVALGKDSYGKPALFDLKKFNHILIAGKTVWGEIYRDKWYHPISSL